MKTLKKLVFSVMILGLMCILMVGLGTTASANNLIDSGECGDSGSNVTWELYDDGLLVISGEGNISDYDDNLYDDMDEIPPYSQTRDTGECSIIYDEFIKKIIINDGVTGIGNCAFSNLHALKSVSIPDSVTRIGGSAFDCCWSLKSVTIPDSVTRIGGSAFENCGSLTSVNIPDSVTIIGSSAFEFCGRLTSVTISDSVTNIGSGAFSNTGYYKKSSNWENNVLYIGKHLIEAKENITSCKIKKGTLTISEEAFADCSKLQSITIPESITNISAGAFISCSKLTSITIPVSVTKIFQDAFKNCTSLKNVYYTGSCAQWKKIERYSGSSALTNAEIDFAKPHIFKDVVTKATLTKNGKIESKCSDCGYSKTIPVYCIETITLSATKFTYNGKAKAPTVTVKDSKGKTLVKDKDYTVSYSAGKTKVGKYAVTVKFKGNYSGTVTKYFLILPGKTSKVTATTTATTLKATWNKVANATGYKVEIINSSGSIVKKVNTKNNYYTFTGLTTALNYKVKVTAYKTIKSTNEYAIVSTTVSTYTKPSTPTLTLSSTSKGKATLKWSNVSRESGYQVYYSTSKNGTYTKAGVYKADTVSGSKSNLTSGKTYYFKVRAYKKVGSTTIYGGWSTVKSVKIK